MLSLFIKQVNYLYVRAHTYVQYAYKCFSSSSSNNNNHIGEYDSSNNKNNKNK